MNFQQTGLPDTALFQDAFKAGWAKYLDRFEGDIETAGAQYARGPVAMSRLICEHGGDCRQVAAAACLAGPAVFSSQPADWLNNRLLAFSRDVTGMQTSCTRDFCGVIPRQSGDMRLFFQASAILMMEQLADPVTGPRYAQSDAQRVYADALEIYSAARGTQDAYKLDTRFEIAAMKVTTVLESRPHIWTQCRKAAAPRASAGMPL
ncbi:MAG: hypothetical protein H3C49_00545 [Alphaproteobacteria bacterium]|nr:hypothetical protein [Alphaproteobacteria bacterium]